MACESTSCRRTCELPTKVSLKIATMTAVERACALKVLSAIVRGTISVSVKKNEHGRQRERFAHALFTPPQSLAVQAATIQIVMNRIHHCFQGEQSISPNTYPQSRLLWNILSIGIAMVLSGKVQKAKRRTVRCWTVLVPKTPSTTVS